MSPLYFISSMSLTTRYTIIALVLSAPFQIVQAQDNNTTVPTYSRFDLFKNSGLSPCSISNTSYIPVQNVDKRSPRGGGGGGHGGGGGGGGGHSSGGSRGSSSSGGHSSSHTSFVTIYGGRAAWVSDLVYEAWVKKGDNSYCQYINQTHMPVSIHHCSSQ
jgi:hypothetical protein